VSDEIHFDLIRPGFKHTVAASLPEAQGLPLVTLTAPSKTFNIAGLQCANILIEDPVLRQRFVDEGSKDGSHGINALGLAACEIAYTRCEPWLEEFLSLIDTNHRTVVEFMASQCPQILVTALEGTYLQWVDFRALRLSDSELEQFLVDQAQLVLTPGIDFGAEGSGFMRMNLGCTPQVLHEGLVHLAKALNAFSSMNKDNGQ
jgi:bifunctional pyridoxal-dependent enzyme with beta-cystathionase and maltose regulon repressor activities